MVPVNTLTSEAHRLSSKARRSFLEGHPVEARDILGKLYDFLDDEFGSKARDKCESDESSKP